MSEDFLPLELSKEDAFAMNGGDFAGRARSYAESRELPPLLEIIPEEEMTVVSI